MARFKKGTYKVRDDISGFVVNSDECRMRWDGLFVRRKLWNPRHPQDFGPFITEEKTPAIPRPEGTDQFVSATDVTADDL